MILSKELKFYTHQGLRTKVVENTFVNFPDDVSKIVKIIQGLLIHVGTVHLYDIELPKSRIQDRNLKTVQEVIDKVKLLNSKSLLVSRKPEERVVIICKHFSMVLASVLRSKGIPARARCGFAIYLSRGNFEDHWICEYWNKEQEIWIKVDAQIDDVLASHRGIKKENINSQDLLSGEFLYGGDLWKLYRAGIVDGVLAGFYGIEGLRGEWYIRGNMMRDFFSLNEIEYTYFEEDDLMSENYTPTEKDLEFLDKVADLTSKADQNFEEIRKLYKDRKDLRPDNT